VVDILDCFQTEMRATAGDAGASGDHRELVWLQRKAQKGVREVRQVEGRCLGEGGVLEVTGGSEFDRRSLQQWRTSASELDSLAASSSERRGRGERGVRGAL
jgi:hypothetical protein